MEDRRMQQFTCGDYNYESDVKITRSGPDIRLTELEQQLEVAETKCGSLKSQLDYMKMLYQGVQPCSEEEFSEKVEEIPITETRLENVTQSSPVVETVGANEEDYQENGSSDLEDVKYYGFLKEIQKMQEITREFDNGNESRSPKVTPRFVENYNSTGLEEEPESISAERRHMKSIRKSHILLGAAADTETHLRLPEIYKEDNVDDSPTFKDPRDYSARLQSDMATARNLTNRYIMEDESERKVDELDEQEKTSRKQELVLKLSESVESVPIVTVKRKRVVKVDKKQKTGLGVKKSVNSKYDDTLSVISNNKSKKKKGRLINASSKNTVMTKEANLTDRRDSKKRKQKAYSSATHVQHRFQPLVQRLPGKTRAEVVEIYHNDAVEGGSGSVSVSSSKHSKHEAARHLQNDNSILKKDRQAVPAEMVLQNDGDAGVTFNQNSNEDCREHSSGSRHTQNYDNQDSNGKETHCQSAPHPTRYYDPTITKNYELPTVASKLKKVNRSYFSRFNFRNIPFVVSTSVSPSHNLGLNIQQVLSIMKTRQPMPNAVAPLMIRKMSKGIRPVSTLLDRIHSPSYSLKSPKSTIPDKQNNLVAYGRPKTAADCAESFDETVYSKYTSCLTTQVGRLQLISNTGINSDEKTSQNPTLREEDQEEINVGDNLYNRNENASGTAKGIREVLVNLHDQFEELNTKYEKLQEEANKSKDKSVTKEVAALEKELNAKEAEINAVVGLYKEVLQLKQQVNSIHGKNSFVCIATSEDPSGPVLVPRSGQMQMRRLVTNPMQIFNMRSKAVFPNNREPATATRLAGLLREIQSFQKQLLAL